MGYKYEKRYRLSGYDYTSDGYYFVTICTKDRENFFGEIVTAEMKLSDVGEIAKKFLLDIPTRFKGVELDEWVIMPNHVHGLVFIWHEGRNAPRRVPTGIGPLVQGSLASVINHYKGNVKRFCNKNGFGSFGWQPRFHDRIVRNEEELGRIREYIRQNPEKWERDRNNLSDFP